MPNLENASVQDCDSGLHHVELTTSAVPTLDVRSNKSIIRWVGWHRNIAERALIESDPTLVNAAPDVPLGEAISRYLNTTNRILLTKAASFYYGQGLEQNNISLVFGGGAGSCVEKEPTTAIRSDADLFALTTEGMGVFETPITDRGTFRDCVTALLEVGNAVGLHVGLHQKCLSDVRENFVRDNNSSTLVLTLEHLYGAKQVSRHFCEAIKEAFTTFDNLKDISLELAKRVRQRHVDVNAEAALLEQNVKNGLLRDIDAIGWLLSLARMAGEKSTSFPELFGSDIEREKYREIRNTALLFKHALHYTSDPAWKREDPRINTVSRSRMAVIGERYPELFKDGPDRVRGLYLKLFQVSEEARLLLLGMVSRIEAHYHPTSFEPQSSLTLEALQQLWSVMPPKGDEKMQWGKKAAPALIQACLDIAAFPVGEDHNQRYAEQRLMRLRGYSETITVPIAKAHETAAAFRAALDESQHPSTFFSTLHRVGLLGRIVPAWKEHVCGHLDLNETHVYSVASHSMRAQLRLDSLLQIGILGHPEFLQRVELPQGRELKLLYLALALHDCGKKSAETTQEDHSARGAAITKSTLTALGYSTEEVNFAERLVLMHNFLSTNAQLFARPSPQILAQLAVEIPDRKFLVALFLHTIADKVSSNESRWNETRTEAIWALFAPLYDSFGHTPRGKLSSDISPSAIAEFSKNHTNPVSAEEVAAHFELLPQAYPEAMSPLTVHTHLRLVRQLYQRDIVPNQKATAIESTWAPITADTATVSVVAPHQKEGGFLRHLAAFFADSGLSVTKAALFTRDDGVACNVFMLHRPVGGFSADLMEIYRDKLERLLIDQERHRDVAAKKALAIETINGATDFRIAGFEKKRRELGEKLEKQGNPVTVDAVQVAVDVVSDAVFSVRIKCPDSPGLLAIISDVFSDHGLSIRAATLGVDDRGVKNAFEVELENGTTVFPVSVVRHIRDRLLEYYPHIEKPSQESGIVECEFSLSDCAFSFHARPGELDIRIRPQK